VYALSRKSSSSKKEYWIGCRIIFQTGIYPNSYVSTDNHIVTIPYHGDEAEYHLTFRIEVVPFDEDLISNDNDGISDLDEYNIATRGTGFSNIPVWCKGYASPTQKDLFVEVDGMFRFIDGHLPVYYQMSDQAAVMVTTMFREGAIRDKFNGSAPQYWDNDDDPIWLHIDRGGMGGGGSIDHYEDTVHWIDSVDPRSAHSGEWDDFVDYKWGGDDDHNGIIDAGETGHKGYFTASRFGLFHYALIVADGKWQGKSNYAGLGETPGDDFIIYYDKVNSKTTGMAKVFAHELSHHFGVPTQYTNKKSLSYSPVEDCTTFTFTSSEWTTINNGFAHVNSKVD